MIPASGLQARPVAYPDVIAVAAPWLMVRPQVELASTTSQLAWATQLLDRINGCTGHHHTDTTAIEQWVQNRRRIASARASTR